MTHTPTPWKAMGNEARGFQIHTNYANGKPAPHLNHWIATLRCESCPGDAEANAAFIVRACNVYEELLQALRNVTYHGRHPDEGEDSSWAETWQDVIAAIALAEGK